MPQLWFFSSVLAAAELISDSVSAIILELITFSHIFVGFMFGSWSQTDVLPLPSPPPPPKLLYKVLFAFILYADGSASMGWGLFPAGLFQSTVSVCLHTQR